MMTRKNLVLSFLLFIALAFMHTPGPYAQEDLDSQLRSPIIRGLSTGILWKFGSQLLGAKPKTANALGLGIGFLASFNTIIANNSVLFRKAELNKKLSKETSSWSNPYIPEECD